MNLDFLKKKGPWPLRGGLAVKTTKNQKQSGKISYAGIPLLIPRELWHEGLAEQLWATSQ